MKNLNINLNEQQVEAVEKMVEWSKRKDGIESTFILSGSAGTGKTTVTNEFIKQCGLSSSVVAVSAPTHKAKRVIEKITGLAGHTLQSLLGLRPNLDLKDFNPNKPEFQQKAEPVISKYKLIIIDECSMVNQFLEETLVEQAKIYNCKLLYLGDANQLPPVGEKISKTFVNPNFKYKLTKIMRQSEHNPLSKFLEILRLDVENETENYLAVLGREKAVFNELGEGFQITRNIPMFEEKVDEYFASNEFSSDFDYSRYLAWTNDSVKTWNTYIRNKLYHSSNDLEAGEFLLCYKTYATPDGSIITANSEEYIVKNVTKQFSSTIGGDCSIVQLYDALYNVVPRRVFVDSSALDSFKKVIIGKQQQAKQFRGGWLKYYDFKGQFMLLHDIKDDYNLVCPKDFDYGYGITVHKSQGSTYNSVFINAADILKNRDSVERTKLLYVALSRAKNQAYILI